MPPRTDRDPDDVLNSMLQAVDAVRGLGDGLRAELRDLNESVAEIRTQMARTEERAAGRDRETALLMKVVLNGNGEPPLQQAVRDIRQSVNDHHQAEAQRTVRWHDAQWKIAAAVLTAVVLAALAFVWQAVQYRIVQGLTDQMRATITIQDKIEKRVGITEDKQAVSDRGQKP